MVYSTVEREKIPVGKMLISTRIFFSAIPIIDFFGFTGINYFDIFTVD